MNYNTKTKKTGVFPLIFREYAHAHPFGSQMPGRQKAAESYRFGFTGHEKENEITEGVYSTEYRLLDTRLGIWRTPDPLFMMYPSWSSYHYTLNNPINHIDPDGRWSKAVHHQMIEQAVNGMWKELKALGMTKADRTALIKGMQKGSDIADAILNRNQSVKNSHIHYMRDPSISVDDAKKNAHDYVDKNINDFKKTGNSKFLGKASHTMMDAVCPSHVDENGDPLINDLGINPAKIKEHKKGDKNPTQSERKKGVENVKAVIREGMGIKNPNQDQKQEQGKVLELD